MEFTQKKMSGLLYSAFSAGLFCYFIALISLLFESKFCEEQSKVGVEKNVNNHYEASGVHWCLDVCAIKIQYCLDVFGSLNGAFLICASVFHTLSALVLMVQLKVKIYVMRAISSLKSYSNMYAVAVFHSVLIMSVSLRKLRVC